MRIGQMTEVYKPVINGVTNFISLHKRVLESWDHKVFVFTLGHEDYEDEELHIIRSPAIPLSDTGYYLNFRFSRRARRKIKTMDVLHVHHPFISGRQAVSLGKRYGIPVVYTNHTRYDLQARYYIPFVPEGLAGAFLEAYLPRFTEQCDLVVAPSTGTAQVMREIGVACPIEIIPNGIDLDSFREPRFPRTRAELGINAGEKVLITVGRIGPEKNLTFLLNALVGICQLIPETNLLLIGEGGEKDDLIDLARDAGITDRVRFIGQVGYDEVPGYLAISDAFVTASVAETFGMAAVEAMAAGVPVVGIASTGIGEVVENGVSGLIVPHDVPAFIRATADLLADDDLHTRLSGGARKASKKYAIARTSRKLLMHYQRLVQGRATEGSL
jgi:1,2-diacylglycerol 3-alpha-glucosyltransferase